MPVGVEFKLNYIECGAINLSDYESYGFDTDICVFHIIFYVNS